MQVITRDEAADQGKRRYFTGEPCKRGHIAERFVSNTGCVKCIADRKPRSAAAFYQPLSALYFSDSTTTAFEAQLAFLYIEENGWLKAAVDAVRSNPELHARLSAQITPNALRRLKLDDYARNEAAQKLQVVK